MSDVLIGAGYEVESSDLYHRGYGKVRDFLTIGEQQDNVVTNPPFNVAEPLLLHALNLTRGRVCFLLRTAFLESIRRYNSIFSTRPPETLLVFSERLSMYPKGFEVNGGGTTSYSWFIWNNASPTKQTEVVWIAPGLKPKSVRVPDQLSFSSTEQS